MSPVQETNICEALELIAPAKSEQTLVEEGIGEIARILHCSRQRAGYHLAILRREKKIKVATAMRGGIPDERKPLSQPRFRWSRSTGQIKACFTFKLSHPNGHYKRGKVEDVR